MNRRKMISGAAIVGAAFAAAPARGEADAPGKAAIEGFAAALNAHDIKAFAELFADDYVNHQISAAAPPPSGKSAKTATVDFFAARLNALPDLRVGVEASLAQGDLAAASFVYEGAHGADYYGVAPTGRRCVSRPAIFFACAMGASWNIGAWATSPACSRNCAARARSVLTVSLAASFPRKSLGRAAQRWIAALAAATWETLAASKE